MQETTTKKIASPPPKLADLNPAIVRQIKLNQTVHCLRNLMVSLQIGPDKAMELLLIPQKERKSYRAILTNNKDKKKL